VQYKWLPGIGNDFRTQLWIVLIIISAFILKFISDSEVKSCFVVVSRFHLHVILLTERFILCDIKDLNPKFWIGKKKNMKM